MEIRLIHVSPGGPPCTLRVGGWAIADQVPPSVAPEQTPGVAARSDGLRSVVAGLRGLPLTFVAEHTGTNAYGRHSAIPYVTSAGAVVPGFVYAALIALTADPAPLPQPTVDVADDAASITWPDGTVDTITVDTATMNTPR